MASALSAVFFLNNECIEIECGLGITKECQVLLISTVLPVGPKADLKKKNKICGAV